MKRTSKNVHEALKRLKVARIEQSLLRKEIDALRKKIADAGYDPDPPKVDLTPRNKKIYKSWKDGKTFKEVGIQYDLTATRISSICHRIDTVLGKRNSPQFKKYKDLLPYYDG